MPDSAKSNSHAQRWYTGLAIGLPVLACLSAGPVWTWWLLVSITGSLGTWELQGILFQTPLPSRWRIFSFSVALAMPLATLMLGAQGINLVLMAAIFGAFSMMLICSPRDPEEIGRIAHLVLTWVYVPYLLSHMLLLGAFPEGRFWVIFVLGVIVAGDAGAYHTGVAFGRHKLFEKVSPKKTIEGALGGLAASLLMGVVLGLLFSRGTGIGQLLAFGFLVAVAGQTGDLIESMIKRNCGKKDSSTLLPGHGGILDRLDSLLFSFPLMWLLLQWAA